MSTDEDSIRSVLLGYRDGLNAGLVEKCVGLYSTDGICMPPSSASSTGRAALTTTYQNFFHALNFDVQFDILEVHVVASDYAFARTESHGTTILKSGEGSGKKKQEKNQELFVLRKEGTWKIARYCFNSQNAPR